MLAKIKKIIKENKELIIWIVLLFLSSLFGFALGYLWAVFAGKQPIRFEQSRGLLGLFTTIKLAVDLA